MTAFQCIWQLLAVIIKDYYCGHFPFNQKFCNIRYSDKWYGNFLGKVRGNLEIVEFQKSEPFNQIFQKFQYENQMEWKFPGKFVWKFGYTLGGCPLFRKQEDL